MHAGADWVERSPQRWFDAARARRRHAELEAAALRSALAARPTLPANCFLTVNISPDLIGHERVRAVWAEQGDLAGLVIEFTEQVRIESFAAVGQHLDELRRAGALIAMDDAGSGYAGLQHLLALRPSIIKLDRGLVCDVDRDEAKLALVEMVGRFAGRIDAWLLAEGIERDGELDVLAGLGVPLAQGYLLGRPGPPWVRVDSEAALRAAARQRGADRGTVRHLIETSAVATSTGEAEALLRRDEASAVVLVDAHGRPVTVYHPGTARQHDAEHGLRVNVDTPIDAALLRATTRPPTTRYEPLICTDNAGRLLGVLRIERLIHALASGAENAVR